MKLTILCFLGLLSICSGHFDCLLAQSPEVASRQIQIGAFQLQFATVDEGRNALGTTDEFVRQMSPFDRQVRMQAAMDPGPKAYLEFVRAEVIDWDPKAIEQYRRAIESIRPRLESLKLPPLGSILMIRTTGREESGAAYTRGKVIVFPMGHGANTEKLVAHELYHVISRNLPELRDKLYERIGFRRSDPIQLPGPLKLRGLTNPDAPVLEHVVEIRLSDTERVTVAPVLYANQEFRADSKMTIFSNMEARLMEVERVKGKEFAAKLRDGEPVMHPLNSPDYLRQVGRNSGVVFHPEEILAANFSTYISQRGRVVDQWVIDAIAEEFKRLQESP